MISFFLLQNNSNRSLFIRFPYPPAVPICVSSSKCMRFVFKLVDVCFSSQIDWDDDKDAPEMGEYKINSL